MATALGSASVAHPLHQHPDRGHHHHQTLESLTPPPSQSLGTADPQTYLEFEVAPNNVTFSAFIYNPSKVRAAGAAFDRFYITDLAADKLTATTQLDPPNHQWISQVQIPLGFFNVDAGCAKGTQWRMNFFRTVTSAATFPVQEYGGWSAPDETNFHMTPFFGHVDFV